MISRSDIKMPRLAAELHAQFSPHLSLWDRPGEGACISAKLEQAIKANLRGLGYGG
jgi:hypothetical protein